MALILLAALTQIVLNEIAAHGFAESSVNYYRRGFANLLKVAKANGIEHYTSELKELFLKSVKTDGSERTNHCRLLKYQRCIHLIESYLDTGHVDFGWSLLQRDPVKYVPACFRPVYEQYLKSLSADGLKSKTIRSYRYIVSRFLRFLGILGYSVLEDIRKGDVQKFLGWLTTNSNCKPESLRGIASGLRRFLEANAVTRCLAIEIPERLPKKEVIVKCFSDKEQEDIKSTACSYMDISLRDRAATIIALYLGLRAVDIQNLRFSNIDWDNEEISFTQEKTEKPMSLPLTADIGNALYEYLKKERRDSDSDFVFISTKPPFGRLSSMASVISRTMEKYMEMAEVEQDGREIGVRTSRRTFATSLIRKCIPLDIISAFLGHRSPDTVMHYLSADEEMIAECTLPLPGGKEDGDGRG